MRTLSARNVMVTTDVRIFCSYLPPRLEIYAYEMHCVQNSKFKPVYPRTLVMSVCKESKKGRTSISENSRDFFGHFFVLSGAGVNKFDQKSWQSTVEIHVVLQLFLHFRYIGFSIWRYLLEIKVLQNEYFQQETVYLQFTKGGFYFLRVVDTFL